MFKILIVAPRKIYIQLIKEINIQSNYYYGSSTIIINNIQCLMSLDYVHNINITKNIDHIYCIRGDNNIIIPCELSIKDFDIVYWYCDKLYRVMWSNSTSYDLFSINDNFKYNRSVCL